MLFSTPRGVRDILPLNSVLYADAEDASRKIFAAYGYAEIRTPIMEVSDLFIRTIGETTDIVEKEMFLFEDRGGRKLALRPEGTAGVVRSYVQHSLHNLGAVTKLFYIGPMFRAERPQAGRYREFWQIGAEYFGNAVPSSDAEIIILAKDVLKSMGAKDLALYLNSIGCSVCRPVYREKLLAFLEQHKEKLCHDCQKRLSRNPLRVLDCKNDSEFILGMNVPKSVEHLCPECRCHFEGVKKCLQNAVPGLIVAAGSELLVRGLDYYTRTVFEWRPAGVVGGQDTLAAGGRYDNLVSSLGGPDVPAVGFALGLDRTLEMMTASQSGTPPDKKLVFVVVTGDNVLAKAFSVLHTLRESSFPADGLHGGKSLKAQMRQASAKAARWVVIVGEAELARGVVAVKDMEKQTQQEIELDKLVEYLKRQTNG